MLAQLRRCVLVLAVIACATATVGAQGIRLEGSLVYATLGGDDFETTKAGIGFEGALSFRLNPKFRLAVGVTRTTHDEEDIDLTTAALQVFAEPRYTFAARGEITPYIFGRVGWVNATADDLDAKATGFAFGGGLGILCDLSGALGLNVSAGFHKLSLGDAEGGGTTIPESDASGNSIQLRAGLTFGFGGSSALRTR